MMSETQNTDCILVIMAKAPRLGTVKTRLAQHLPPPIVTDLYRCLFDDTLTLAHALRGVEVAVMCPAADVEDLSSVIAGEVRVVGQSGEGLAAALTSVFAHFGAAAHRRVIAFNSDSPHLPVSVLEKAFDTLASCDLVVGPTDDGGYYLVGASTTHSLLFADDGMGTGTALQTLLARAHKLGLALRLTDTFYDVDELTDLERLAAELHQFPAKAPRTAEWFSRCGSAVPRMFRKG
jgi:uncharacterized protein